MKLRLVRLNPLTMDPGEMFVMCGRSLDGPNFSQFPARLEYNAQENPLNSPVWLPVEFTNEFQSNEGDDAREMRVKVQVPVYSKPARNKGSGGNSGGEPS